MRVLRILVVGMAVVAVFAAIVVLGIVLLVDPNRLKPRVAQAASEAIGFSVAIDGDLGVGLGRGVRLTLNGVRIHDGADEIGTAAAAVVGIATQPLLRGRVRVRDVALHAPRLNVVRDHDGRWNVSPPEPPREDPDIPTRIRVTVADGVVHLEDRYAEARYVARGVALEVDPLHVDVPRDDVGVLERLMLRGGVTVEQLETPALDVRDIDVSVAGEDGVLDLVLRRLELFGGTATGHGRAELLGRGRHRAFVELTAFEVGELYRLLGDDVLEDTEFDARGDLNFAVDLALTGDSIAELLASMNGAAWLQGRELVITGADFDEKLSRYETLTEFRLVDAGALFFAGPLGLLVARGQELAQLFEAPGDETRIRALHAHWDVTDGVALARDVALATDSHRIALKGGLDFPNGRFDDVTVAVVDDEGCVLLEQDVTGPFGEPDVDEPTLPEILAEVVFDLLEEVLELLGAADCDVFYDGALSHPD
jgi:hypothetical protein